MPAKQAFAGGTDLIQVAQLTVEGDDGSGGRGPKQAIKPVFTQPAAAQQPQVAPIASPSQSMNAATPVAPQAVSQQVGSFPAVNVRPGGAVSPSGAMPDAVRMAQFKEEKKIPVMKKSSLGLSIKHPQRRKNSGERVLSILLRCRRSRSKKILFSTNGI